MENQPKKIAFFRLYWPTFQLLALTASHVWGTYTMAKFLLNFYNNPGIQVNEFILSAILVVFSLFLVPLFALTAFQNVQDFITSVEKIKAKRKEKGETRFF